MCVWHTLCALAGVCLAPLPDSAVEGVHGRHLAPFNAANEDDSAAATGKAGMPFLWLSTQKGKS